MDKKPIAFFVRCKPQGQDIIDLVLHYKMAPIGYPPLKNVDLKNIEISNLNTWIFNVKKFNEEFTPKDCLKDWQRNFSLNKNIINDVVPGSLILIPRPERGVCYMAEVEKYILEYNREFHMDYRSLRERNIKTHGDNCWGNDDRNHVGDIVQGWKFKTEPEEVPFFEIPGWIRKSLFGRGTMGRIKNDAIGKDSKGAYDKLMQIYKSERNSKMPLFEKEDDTERLCDFLTPESFEHFICNILHLKNRKNGEFWWHVGGSGDGGVDCMGFDENGRVMGIAQISRMA